ncbi:MAG: hypothetical protein J0H94_12195 [Rhizobiales bacterium]|jgi:hypothetical protein|nr:hypothetical protein [Hyphomicrobiales bacterium]
MDYLAGALRWGLIVGVLAFLVGFIGPTIWAPDANQGPLLGIFITGPLGFIAGAVLGIIFVALRPRRRW